MPFFSFNVTPKQKQHEHKTKIRDKWVILDNDIEGIVIIDNNANYYILLDNDTFIPILESNYNCKGHITIYSQFLYYKDLSRIIYHRTEFNKYESFPNLPFCVGAIVNGDVIFNNDTALKRFNIKRCFIDNTNTRAIAIFKQFKNNYNIYVDKIISKINEY